MESQGQEGVNKRVSGKVQLKLETKCQATSDCLFIFIFGNGSFCSPGWPGTHFVVQHGLPLRVILLPQSPES